MRIIKPYAKICFNNYRPQNEMESPDIEVYSKIEEIGRVCYKSEDRITDTSHINFIRGLLSRGHGSVIEHHVFVLKVRPVLYDNIRTLNPKYLNFTEEFDKVYHAKRLLISGSARAFKDLFIKTKSQFALIPIEYLRQQYPLLFEDIITDDSVKVDKFDAFIERELTSYDVDRLYPKEKLKHKFITVRFVCDRGVSHEIVRHRPCSFSMESTRYCNYSKDDDSGSGITYIEPLFYPSGWKRFVWKVSCKVSEWSYMILTKVLKSTPQEARSILNNSLKTEIIVTTNLEEWELFFMLRDDKAAHPQMREVTKPLHQEFINNKYV